MKGRAASVQGEILRRQAISKASLGNQKWCDSKTGKHRNDHRELMACCTCGKPVLRPRAHINPTNFCSRKCLGVHNAKRQLGTFRAKSIVADLTCAQCGRAFKKLKNQVKGQVACCSRECFAAFRKNKPLNKTHGERHWNWRGGAKEWYGPGWYVARRVCRELAGHKCAACGALEGKQKHHAHHVVPFRMFGRARHEEANQQSNLICYCASCHRRVEAAYQRGEVTASLTLAEFKHFPN
jgi:hypothetical protein